MAAPRISLCLIARDEAAFIDSCLKHARSAVDEIVVLDTGSRDDTVARARRRGARVVCDTWRDDFADARNRALAAATGDWVLVLDADEQLALGSAKALRAFVRREDVDAGLIALHNAADADASHTDVLSGDRRRGAPTLLPRLFRRTPDLRWEGAIHETPQTFALARASRFREVSGATIVHYGAVPSLVVARGKAERNLRLLRARAEAEPDDPTPLAYIAGELLTAGDVPGADTAIEEAWVRTLARRAAGQPGLGTLRVCVVRMHRASARGDHDAVLETAALARASAILHPDIHFINGSTHETLAGTASTPALRDAELRAALASYRAALAQRGETLTLPYDAAVVGWLGHYCAGRVLVALGEPEAAIESFVASAADAQDKPHPALFLAELALDANEAALAEDLLVPWLDIPQPDAGALAAEAAIARSDVATGLSRARAAAARIKEGAKWVEGHRSERFSRVLRAGGAAPKGAR